jgi:hypothetical protein
MRDLTKRGVAAISSSLPKGLAFEIVDLLLVRSWADLNDLRMMVLLDHGTESEEYEEAIAFRTVVNPFYRLIMWRNADAVFVQPLVGRRRRYCSVAEALESVLPEAPISLTDIAATEWPTG